MLSVKVVCVVAILLVLVGIMSDTSYGVAAYKRDGSDESDSSSSEEHRHSSSSRHTHTHNRHQQSGEIRHNNVQDGPSVHHVSNEDPVGLPSASQFQKPS